MLLNKAEIYKALDAYKGEDTQERSVALLKSISEEFVKIREEYEKREAEKKEQKTKEQNLREALKTYNKDFKDRDIDNLMKFINTKNYIVYSDDSTDTVDNLYNILRNIF